MPEWAKDGLQFYFSYEPYFEYETFEQSVHYHILAHYIVIVTLKMLNYCSITMDFILESDQNGKMTNFAFVTIFNINSYF